MLRSNQTKMISDRPQLLDKIRISIQNYKITYIFGNPGVGKTTICNQCLQKYFNNEEIYVLRNYSSIRYLETYTFNNGIYVLEDFNALYIDEYIIDYIYKRALTSNAKFILISTNRHMGLKTHILDVIKPYINLIEINSFTNDEMNDYLQKLFQFDDEKILSKIFSVTKGNALLSHEIGHLLLNKFTTTDDLNIIYKPCIVDKYGNKIDEIDSHTKIIVTEINDKLLYELAKNPKLLHNLSSYDFERVIAKIFEKQGFSVEITPKTRDGGKDIFIAKQGLASFLFYVECKKYAPNKPVGIDVIQRLYGVISAEKANGGFIATTSHFTKPAEDYIEEYNLEHQLTLQDYNTISDILKSLQHNTQ